MRGSGATGLPGGALDWPRMIAPTRKRCIILRKHRIPLPGHAIEHPEPENFHDKAMQSMWVLWRCRLRYAMECTSSFRVVPCFPCVILTLSRGCHEIFYSKFSFGMQRQSQDWSYRARSGEAYHPRLLPNGREPPQHNARHRIIVDFLSRESRAYYLPSTGRSVLTVRPQTHRYLRCL